MNTRLLGVLLVCHAAAAQVITTVVGTDFSFPSGSIAAVSAPLGALQGVAVDTAGNVFVTDSSNNLVLRISANGRLNIVAGNGIAGFSGDEGPATSASLNFPTGVAVDSAGNLYIADGGNGRIRIVSNGTITTVAGNGNSGFSGDGGPAIGASFESIAGVAVDSAGNLYIADDVNNRIRMVSNGTITTVAGNGEIQFAGDGGPATSASLGAPEGVAVDSAGNLYIADVINRRIRKVSNGTITTVAGNGNGQSLGDGGPAVSASLEPWGVAVDSAGNLYIAEISNSRIRKVSNGTIITFAGDGNHGFSGDGGPATNASLNQPSGVAVDSAGDLYISEAVNERIRKVSGGAITTFAGDGNYRFLGDGAPAVSASLNQPSGVAMDSARNLYIADTYNNRIRKLSAGIITTVAGNGSVGFSGDGGPATNASLSAPYGVAVDSAGDLYIADYGNARIRKVSNGTITTVAGNGNQGFSGDGGPATSASFGAFLSGVAVDSAGSLYIADTYNNRIRKVSNGTITTFAGNGNNGFSGDGGSATSASLNYPFGVAVDSAGNVYVGDTNNNRIRKVSNGTITTFAGNGSGGFSGDGGPATSASLNGPYGVAVDSAGNLYIADPGNQRVRKVSDGTIMTVAGNGDAGFSGDGGPATSASLNFDFGGVAVDSAGNLYIADTGNNRIREVLVNPPSFSSPLAVGASSLSLSQESGGKAVTATLNADITTTQNSSEAVPGMAYSAAVSSGSSWLSVSPQSGTTPSLITVTADPLNLSPGTYNGAIIISVPLANPQLQTVNVQFTVTPGVPPAVVTDQSHMSFTYATTSAARSQTLIVSNSGGGSLNFTTSISLNSGVSANWVSVTPQSGTATPGNPVALAVRADPSSLGPGTYTGSLTIQGGTAGSVTIPITMTIAANPLVMLLSQAGLTFTAVENGGAIPPQTFGVLSLGSGTLNWSVQTSTLPAGGSWLIATPGSGSSNAAAPSPPVTVSVNPAGLQPGVYYGLVTVVSAGAANSPQEVVAVLRVLPPGTDVAPVVQPSSLIFTAPAGVSSPSSQNVLVYDPTGTGKSFSSGIVTNGSGQVVTLPTDATISPAEPAQIVVQPIVNGLSPGTYPGTLTLQFSDGRVNAVGITFVVTGAGSSSAGTQAIPRDSGSSTCTPMKLIPTLTTLSPSFNVLVGYPTGLSAQVMDDCGNPQTSGHVTVTFTNGDAPVGLKSLNNGTWQATWYAGTPGAGQPVKLTVTAAEMQPQISGTAEVNGGISASQEQPMIMPGGVVGAASPVSFTALAPGGIISIYGSLLADSAASAANIPLPTTLGNANVIIGGQTVPLYFASPGQINAVVPFGLNTNTSYSVLIQRDLAISSPFAVDIADAQPGAFLSGGSAIVEDYRGTAPAFLVTPSAPAQAGDTLVIYCAGLGVTNPPVGDGVASPSSPPAQTQSPVTVTIGGQNAPVSFAGLTPTLVGLYQVNVTMPAGVTPGSAVPVLLTVAGQTSPAATIATQ